jgi:hypothetical protein
MDPGVIAVFIPIIAIVMGIGIGMLAIWSEHKRKAQLLEQNHRERMHAIEKGLEIPPLPPGLVGFMQSAAVASSARALRSGLIWLLSGIVGYVAIKNAGGPEGAPFALIGVAVGIAQLIYAVLLRKKEKEVLPDVEKP